MAPLAAHASGVTAESASASLLADHPGGCVGVTVEATQLKRQGQVLRKLVSVSLSQDRRGVDCASKPVLRLLASGHTDRVDFSFGEGSTGAELNASVPLSFHDTGASTTFTVSATWSGVGDQSFSERHRRISLDAANPALGTIEHTHGHIRQATVRMVLSDGGANYVARLSRSEASLHVSTTFSSQDR